MRALITGPLVLRGNDKKIKKASKDLYENIVGDQLEAILKTAITCFDEAVKRYSEENDGKDFKNDHRFVGMAFEVASRYNENIKKDKYLLQDDIVPCAVSYITKSFAGVKLKTTDSRNIGSIHISKIKRKYISDIHEELKIGQEIRAKIIGEYDIKYGWEMSAIL